MERAQPLVFIAGDDILVVEQMSDILVENGYATVRCTNSAQAYDSIREHMPDLIVFDLAWRGPISGLFVLDLLQLDSATSAIPIIVCSGATAVFRTTKQWLLQQGCTVFEKPFDTAEWLDAVKAKISLPAKH